MLTNLTNKKGKEMRKKTMRKMIIAGAVALLLPTAAMAEWDQSELRNNQEDHDEMINVYTAVHTLGDFSYGMESAIGYDSLGNGTASLNTKDPFKQSDLAPWNTTPCPIQLADTTYEYTWDVAMGNCPAQTLGAGKTIGQTDAAYGEGDNEIFGVILDDLYQSLTETATTLGNENGKEAFKKVDQVLDILFYRSNSAGEVFGVDGWKDVADFQWYGGLGIDQTLDQDIADIEGTGIIAEMAGGPEAHGTWLWNYDHVAQTFYQDFQLFDLGNTFGPNENFAHLNTANKRDKGNNTPRNRHGIELLAICAGTGACTYDTGDSNNTDPDDGGGWGEFNLDPEDFAFFDQWVIQSMRDSDEITYDGSAAPGTQSFTSNFELKQSYSSWMSQGVPGVLCDSVNEGESANNGVCTYEYKKESHKVNKSIAENSSVHQTGDP